MDTSVVVNVANLCQAAIAPICLTAYLPQWVTIIQSRSSKNISLRSYLIWTFGSVLGAFYSATQVYVYGTGFALLATSLISLMCLVISVALIISFRPRPNESVAETVLPAIFEVARAADAVAFLSSERPQRNDSVFDDSDHKDSSRTAAATSTYTTV